MKWQGLVILILCFFTVTVQAQGVVLVIPEKLVTLSTLEAHYGYRGNLTSEWVSVLQQWLLQLKSQVSFSSDDLTVPHTSWRLMADQVLYRGVWASLSLSVILLAIGIKELCKS
ncbi:hypothetical protein [Gilvimarinus xylanilyticus]|uniref:Uncharacterized protein n=1 Tax=Gilvimarinus xylanilyticus TaxID=2944139 RepID=A0A9X2I462_9GAMM|nr:hypothetical protein [Gilvimarinus xylanilyticus]MCP8900443.1 hypothetical protein [Gilvimarinus xylanilyticus]